MSQSSVQNTNIKKNTEAILIEESIRIELRDKEVRTAFWPGGDNLSFQDEDISRVFFLTLNN